MKTNGKLIIALARSYKAIHNDSDQMLKDYGLTKGQFAVMEALYSNIYLLLCYPLYFKGGFFYVEN